ncbi:MAG: hypothetical protein U9Q80_01015 [Bacillota bacterium]|nr:hypothetical protein [Bacillota bacterium]
MDNNKKFIKNFEMKKIISKFNIDFFNNMAIGKKMLGLVSILILVVMIVSLIIVSNINVIKENVVEISDVRMGVIKQVNDIQSTFSEMVININKYMNGFEEFDYMSANQNLLKMSVYVKNAKEFVGDDEGLADFKESISQVEIKIANLSENLKTLKSRSSVIGPKLLKIESDIISFNSGLDKLRISIKIL